LNQLEDTSLEAPFTGYIQNIYFEAHETINKGLPVVSMVDITNLEVETEIPSKIYLESRNFTSYSCHPEEIPNLELPLEMKSIRKKSNMNELYKMIFRMDKPQDIDLAPGMVVEVLITLVKDTNSKLYVPINSVFNEHNMSFVWIIENERVSKREINVGDIFADGSIQVLSGISVNDIIVTAGIHSLREGQRVNEISETSAENVGGLL
jgi:RND family efflux transporter MFP subunit